MKESTLTLRGRSWAKRKLSILLIWIFILLMYVCLCVYMGTVLMSRGRMIIDWLMTVLANISFQLLCNLIWPVIKGWKLKNVPICFWLYHLWIILRYSKLKIGSEVIESKKNVYDAILMISFSIIHIEIGISQNCFDLQSCYTPF